MTTKKKQLIVSVSIIVRYRKNALTSIIAGVHNTGYEKFKTVRDNALDVLNRLYV